MAGTVGTHIKKNGQPQVPWIRRTCLKPASALSKVHPRFIIFQLCCRLHFSHHHHHVFVYVMWQNPFANYSPNYSGNLPDSQEDCEKSEFCLWLVFHSPSFVLSFLSHRRLLLAKTAHDANVVITAVSFLFLTLLTKCTCICVSLVNGSVDADWFLIVTSVVDKLLWSLCLP